MAYGGHTVYPHTTTFPHLYLPVRWQPFILFFLFLSKSSFCRKHIGLAPYSDSQISFLGITMWWLWLVGSIKLWVSYAEYSLFYGCLLQKRPMIESILLTEATPCTVPRLLLSVWWRQFVSICGFVTVWEKQSTTIVAWSRCTTSRYTHVCVCMYVCVYICTYVYIYAYEYYI